MEAVVQGQEHHHEGHDGLAAAHIALQQSVHLMPRAQVLPDFLDDALLGVGQRERQVVAIEAVEIISNYTEDMTLDRLLAVHFVAQHFQLEEKMLLIFQSARGLLDLDVVGRQMDLIIGVAARYQLVFLDEGLGQRLGDVFVDLLQNLSLHLGDGSGTQAVVFHLFGGVVDALQSLADERVFRVVFFYLRVDEIVVVVKLARLAKQHIFHARFEAVLNPFQSSEPHHLDAARLIAEESRGACGPRCTNQFDVGDGANELVIHGVVVNVGHLLDLAAVDVSERKLVEHVLVGGYAQLLLEDFGLLRTDTLQIGDARLQQVHFHAAKITIILDFAPPPGFG